MRMNLACDVDESDSLVVLTGGDSVSIRVKGEDCQAVRLDDRAKVEQLRDALNEWLERNA